MLFEALLRYEYIMTWTLDTSSGNVQILRTLKRLSHEIETGCMWSWCGNPCVYSINIEQFTLTENL
jgi:hypothetical protein